MHLPPRGVHLPNGDAQSVAVAGMDIKSGEQEDSDGDSMTLCAYRWPHVTFGLDKVQGDRRPPLLLRIDGEAEDEAGDPHEQKVLGDAW